MQYNCLGYFFWMYEYFDCDVLRFKILFFLEVYVVKVFDVLEESDQIFIKIKKYFLIKLYVFLVEDQLQGGMFYDFYF